MIAPLLLEITKDLHVSVADAGQLVTVFALTYAISSPVLAATLGGVNRRKLLIASLVVFTVGNLLAWAATSYSTLLIARVLLALSAGLYVPSANAVASALVAPARRGTALAIVNGGLTVAITLGVPVGALIGDAAGWRYTFVGVAVLSVLATVGLLLGLSRDFGRGIPTATLAERLAVARHRPVLLALATTTLWAAGTNSVYTYFSVYFSGTTGASNLALSAAMFLYGLAGAAGMYIGGKTTDKHSPSHAHLPSLLGMTATFLCMAIVAWAIPAPASLIPVFALVIAWGISAWAFHPAQQARLIELTGIGVAPVVLSLNASFLYLGFSIGAAAGSGLASPASAGKIGLLGAAFEVAAIALLLVRKAHPHRTRHVREHG